MRRGIRHGGTRLFGGRRRHSLNSKRVLGVKARRFRLHAAIVVIVVVVVMEAIVVIVVTVVVVDVVIAEVV